MDEQLYELLKGQPFWHWLPREGGRYFDACFNMDLETVPAGEKRQTKGRVGYLISGRAQLKSEADLIRAGEGSWFGVVQPGRPETRKVIETELWAVTECKVLWLDGTVLSNVCYAACWFHARLIREVDGYFTQH
ncbi:MAG: hypothetical protein IJZ66_09440 [Oscillibacter sp.]|nr:hypothetical protein [Oscillibacter sp.]